MTCCQGNGLPLPAGADTTGSNEPPVPRAHDLWALGILAVVILAIMIPMLTFQVSSVRNDAANEVLPRLITVARYFQSGTLPLWDPQTMAGAKPFYADDAATLFYPPMIPFYFLADTHNATQSMLVLMIIPHLLHLLWAAAGAYVFARLVLRLHPVGAFVTGLLWSLSPALLTCFEGQDVFHLSFLPWIATCIIRYIETGRLRPWIGGVLLGALAISHRTPNYLIREYFLFGMMAVMFVGFRLWWQRPASPDGAGKGLFGRLPGMGWAVRRLLGALAMVIMSFGLNALPMAGVADGLRWVTDAFPMTYQTASNLTPESSTPPLYLLSVLIPDFFGVLDSHHGWGITLTEGISGVSLIGGGLYLVITVLAAMIYWLPRREALGQDRNLRTWTWIATILLVLMLFTVMGRYTPVFRWLCAVLPWFFKFPHAVYYRFGVCWGLAILAGIGASCLWSRADFREKMMRWWLPAICVGVALAGVAFALLHRTILPVGPNAARLVPGFRTLIAFDEMQWFLCGPMLYFAVATLCLVAGFILLSPVGRARLLIIGIGIEAVGMAVLMSWVCNISMQSRAWPDLRSQAVRGRYQTLAEYPPYRMAEKMRVLSDSTGTRWTCQVGVMDNQAWPTGGRALLGYACKPLLPEFERLAKRFTVGWPYQFSMTEVPEVFLQNMNVGYIVLAKQDPRLERIDETFSFYKLPAPVPYVYTQDRVTRLAHEEQMDRLFSADLRRSVFVTADVAAEVAKTAGASAVGNSGTEFSALQNLNQVKADRLGPNRLAVDADVRKASMLVITECWHPGWRATLDGQPVPVWQVNYLQQGLWLPEGHHRIELSFFPVSLWYGAGINAGFAAIFLCILICGWLKCVRTKRLGSASGQDDAAMQPLEDHVRPS